MATCLIRIKTLKGLINTHKRLLCYFWSTFAHAGGMICIAFCLLVDVIWAFYLKMSSSKMGTNTFKKWRKDRGIWWARGRAIIYEGVLFWGKKPILHLLLFVCASFDSKPDENIIQISKLSHLGIWNFTTTLNKEVQIQMCNELQISAAHEIQFKGSGRWHMEFLQCQVAFFDKLPRNYIPPDPSHSS